MYRLIKILKHKKQEKNINSIKLKLINEIHNTVCQIAQTELWFQMEVDNNLINSCIYQRELLYSRYRHLIEKAKFYNIKIDPKYLIKSVKEKQ